MKVKIIHNISRLVKNMVKLCASTHSMKLIQIRKKISLRTLLKVIPIKEPSKIKILILMVSVNLLFHTNDFQLRKCSV